MLIEFYEDFQLRYQDIFQKTMIGMKIANTRLKSSLRYGDTVHREILDISGVQVKSVTRYSDRTIPALTDSDETLAIDQQVGADFAIDDWDALQAGPLSPGEYAGQKVANKVRIWIDAHILAETVNAYADFDTGDLTTLSSNGTPIVLSTTNAPILLTKTMAKLQRNNTAEEGSLAIVLDPDSIAIFAQHQIGKDIDMAGSVLKNGFVGPLYNYEVYMSNSLTGEAVLGLATQPTANDTVTINGVTFKFVATLAAAGDLHIGSDVDATRANMAVALNAPGTAITEATDTGYTPVAAADVITLQDLRITATDSASADTLTIVAIGSGKMTLTETFTDGTDAWNSNFIHAYVGAKGSIDIVVQDDVTPDIRKEPKQKTDNILTSALYGKKTFTDGAQKFLDLMIDVTTA